MAYSKLTVEDIVDETYEDDETYQFADSEPRICSKSPKIEKKGKWSEPVRIERTETTLVLESIVRSSGLSDQTQLPIQTQTLTSTNIWRSVFQGIGCVCESTESLPLDDQNNEFDLAAPSIVDFITGTDKIGQVHPKYQVDMTLHVQSRLGQTPSRSTPV